jgi:hypothetical protein
MDANEWLQTFARRLGAAMPSEEEIEMLLELAGTAAHASERKAAPIACWLAARAQVEPGEALRTAAALADPSQ